MSIFHKLKRSIADILYIWRQELWQVVKDEGVLIFLVIHSWRLGLRYNGVVFMIVGFPFLILGAFLPIIVTAVSGLLDTTVAMVSVVANILSAFTGIFLILGGAVFGVGLIAFIVSLIIGSRQNKKYAKAL